jgi:hypothetical protein
MKGRVEMKRTNEFSNILAPVAELLEQKNHDYGRSYDRLREEFGEISFLIRLDDKINRLKTLVKHPAKVTTEAVEDTIKDIIGYCTLELCFRQSKEESDGRCNYCLHQSTISCVYCDEGCNWEAKEGWG